MSLRRRLRRWWGQDRIRLSAEDLDTEALAGGLEPIRLRIDDRLEILGRLYRLTRDLGDTGFEARDDDGIFLVVRASDRSIDLIRADETVYTLDRRDVLIYPVADVDPWPKPPKPG